MNRKKMEQTIAEINGSMTIEKMPLTDADKERLRTILSGKQSADAVVAELLRKHTAAPSNRQPYTP